MKFRLFVGIFLFALPASSFAAPPKSGNVGSHVTAVASAMRGKQLLGVKSVTRGNELLKLTIAKGSYDARGRSLELKHVITQTPTAKAKRYQSPQDLMNYSERLMGQRGWQARGTHASHQKETITVEVVDRRPGPARTATLKYVGGALVETSVIEDHTQARK